MTQTTTIRRRPGRAIGLAAAFLCAIVLSAAPAAQAAKAAPARGAELRLAQASEQVSLAEATRRVQQSTGGQVLRAETKRDKGRVVHRIRVLTEDGRVRTVHVDAESGRMY